MPHFTVKMGNREDKIIYLATSYAPTAERAVVWAVANWSALHPDENSDEVITDIQVTKIYGEINATPNKE